jgi:hypothetical protein
MTKKITLSIVLAFFACNFAFAQTTVKSSTTVKKDTVTHKTTTVKKKKHVVKKTVEATQTVTPPKVGMEAPVQDQPVKATRPVPPTK